MGGNTFFCRAQGKTASEAFGKARSEAQYTHGHGGYTGTIAEKDSFTMIQVPNGLGITPVEYGYRLINEGDSRIDDKWGPAGCIDMGDGSYLFFGWAAS